MAERLERPAPSAWHPSPHPSPGEEATQQLQTLVTDSTRLGNALRAIIKEHYGVRSERLAELGIQPFRGRPRKARPEAPAEPGE